MALAAPSLKSASSSLRLPALVANANPVSMLIAPDANQLFNFAVKMLHPLVVAIPHGVEQRFAFRFSFFDILASAHR